MTDILKQLRHLSYLVVCIIYCSSCNDNQKLKQHIEDYADRMASVLEVEAPPMIPVSLPSYPATSLLQQDIASTNLKLSEFYSLSHCRLYSLVAERNTSLGKIQLPSTRYLYEKNLIQAIDECRDNTSDTALRRKLRYWKELKTINLPKSWKDMIQLSTEIKYAMSSNRALITGSEKEGLYQTKTALTYLYSANQNENISSKVLEQHLQHLKQSFLPAKLWLSQKLIAVNLTALTSWLIQNRHKLNCSNDRHNQKTEYLANVFRLFFIEKIQPLAGKINDYQYQLSPILKKLSTDPALSLIYKKHIAQLNQHGFIEYQVAISEHIALWQSIFKDCDIHPGRI